jgi:hypothetical protein
MLEVNAANSKIVAETQEEMKAVEHLLFSNLTSSIDQIFNFRCEIF